MQKSKITPQIRLTAKPMMPFILPLRNANRQGLKTQTRRTRGLDEINASPDAWRYDGVTRNGEAIFFKIKAGIGNCNAQKIIRSPYGRPGEIRYLLEPLVNSFNWTFYLDDSAAIKVEGDPVKWKWKNRTLSQLHLPKKYARTFFEITGIVCQRVNDITERDAKREGTIHCGVKILTPRPAEINIIHREVFLAVFDMINHKRGLGTIINPFVWVVNYTLVK